MSTLTSERINLRINKEKKELIRLASELKGFKSLSEFVIQCSYNEAAKILSETDIILTAYHDKVNFINAILNPPAPNENLKKAHSNYLKFLSENEGNY